jgi:maltose alpha-D-glucosyltransferase/alpha-amylase
VNVADQRRDPHSLLNWTERIIRARRECPEIPWGTFQLVRTGTADVLVLRYDWRETTLVTLHNFAGAARTVRLRVDRNGGERLVDVFERQHSEALPSGEHEIALAGYGYRWFRVGAADNALNRTPM